MPVNIGQLFTRNWGIKLAAIFFAVMLYVACLSRSWTTLGLFPFCLSSVV